ncbi:TPA: D-tagatose-bisphosphate aldolase, class II, non-catalytic subunit [Providencia rettgeri]
MNGISKLIERHKQGEQVGITSVCSAHPLVLEAAIRHAKDNGSLLLVEATSNQVDHEGGYTGMTPKIFREYVDNLANNLGFSTEKLILGGDHLGPNRWQHLPAEYAMQQAEAVVMHYVAAGFSKIHLDCSMSCGDDPAILSDEVIAKRAARLAYVCEETRQKYHPEQEIVYIIGTEVPVPGGANESLDELEITSEHAAQKTINAHKEAFATLGLTSIWPSVVGLVVQPGVEYSHDSVVDYQADKASSLSKFIENYPKMVFEAHSTDYQPSIAYHELVRDHFAILKVGPALTFALREALYALELIEKELVSIEKLSQLRQVLEEQMLAHPENWQRYYHGDAQQQRLARHFSYSDRLRYYWPNSQVQQAVNQLLANLTQVTIPLTLISQYLPAQYDFARNSTEKVSAHNLIIEHIIDVLRTYNAACQPALL